jgi:hypothetical protein
MPFIITTERPARYVELPDSGDTEGTWIPSRESRRAVATLEEAGDICANVILARVPAAEGLREWLAELEEPGYLPGSVGPLSDGTVIDVDEVGQYDLWVLAGRPIPTKGESYLPPLAEIIDAFNARGANG